MDSDELVTLAKQMVPGRDPAAMTVEELADVLGEASGGAVTLAMIEADVGAGAPVNSDVTIDLLAYMRWSVARLTELEERGRPGPRSPWRG